MLGQMYKDRERGGRRPNTYKKGGILRRKKEFNEVGVEVGMKMQKKKTKMADWTRR